MKLVGTFKGDFRILENLESSQLEELKPDFSWLDVDKIDTKTELLLKTTYGIESFAEFGFPTILSGEKYDTIVLNYYVDQVKREVLIFIFENSVITVHPGKDPVCEETMASVNEMLVSGNFNTEAILYGLVMSLLDKHDSQLLMVEEPLRSITTQLKEGISNINYLYQLNNNSSEIQRVFHDTQNQLGDIISKTVSIRGVKDTELFAPSYSRMNALLRNADDFSRLLDQYNNIVVPYLWAQLGKVKNTAIGLSIFSIAVASASALYALFPNGLYGIESLYVFGAVVALGLVGLAVSQKSMKFKAD